MGIYIHVLSAVLLLADYTNTGICYCSYLYLVRYDDMKRNAILITTQYCREINDTVKPGGCRLNKKKAYGSWDDLRAFNSFTEKKYHTSFNFVPKKSACSSERVT